MGYDTDDDEIPYGAVVKMGVYEDITILGFTCVDVAGLYQRAIKKPVSCSNAVV